MVNKREKKLPKARSSESRESQLIFMATELAEKQLKAGTASSQVITHYLKLGSIRNEAEVAKIKAEAELANAKIEAIKNASNLETLYEDAINAMRIYSGNRDD